MLFLGNVDKFEQFTLGFHSKSFEENTKCGSSFLTLRYCFKGPNIPSRDGGFWTKAAASGEGYVIQNTLQNPQGACKLFGSNG